MPGLRLLYAVNRRRESSRSRLFAFLLEFLGLLRYRLRKPKQRPATPGFSCCKLSVVPCIGGKGRQDDSACTSYYKPGNDRCAVMSHDWWRRRRRNCESCGRESTRCQTRGQNRRDTLATLHFTHPLYPYAALRE